MIVRLKRLALMTVMAVLAMNIWTGGPLFALWLGSRVQGSGPPSMTAVFVVAVTLVLVSLLLLFRWKISNPMLIAATAVVGMIAFPLLKPTWVFVR